MKKLIFISTLLLLPATLFAYTSPGKPSGFVNDFAHILSAQEIQTISSQLQQVNQKTGVEFSVVTIPSLGDETIESYAEKLFAEWGIGNEKVDTGLLILVAPNDRQVRIEVGYGLEGAVTDIQSGNVIRSVMTPAFKEGKYGEGIYAAVIALDAIISKSPEAAQYSVENSSTNNSGSSNSEFNPLAIFFVFVIILNALAKILGKTKSWWLGGVIGAVIGSVIGLIFGFIFIGIIAIIVLTILGLIFDFIVSNRPPGSGGTGFWPMFLGGGRGGSGGSSFGGFGGGMSGGGGASGRW